MADEKITDMAENSDPQGTDLVELVDDPAGTADNQKITIENLHNYTMATANKSAFSVTSYSLTGSSAVSLLDLAGTWNTSGTPTAFKLNITDTASNASSLLMDLQVGGTSEFSVTKDSKVRADEYHMDRLGTARIINDNSNRMAFYLGGQNRHRFGTGEFSVDSNIVIGFRPNTGGTGSIDVGFARAAAGVVEITDGGSNGGAVAIPDAGELTISSGAITVTGTFHTVDTESDAASDDLDTVNGGNDGQILVMQAENGARTVVAKDGTGNLQLAGDFSLDNTQDTLTLIFSNALSAWVEIARSDNGA